METKSNGFLKVTGILMIIGGVVGFISSIILVLGVALFASLAAGTGVEVSTGLLTFSLILALIGAVVGFIAGIVGVSNAAKPEKAQTCIVFGILVIALSVLGNVLGLIAGGSFSVISLFTGLIVPVLYLIGAFQNKSRIA